MITFNLLQLSEIETITSMMQDFYAIDNYPIDIEVSKRVFEEFIADEKLGKAWLIYLDTEVVGYVILTFIFNFEYQGRIAFLDELYLKKNARRKGIGKQTITFIQKEVHKLKLKIVYLEIEPHNVTAQKLYIANDFEIHNRNLMKYIVK